jgi:hypothetical protein
MPELIVDLSQPRVSITSAFQGESLLLFGMFDTPARSWWWCRAGGARDRAAQGALLRPVAEHRPPAVRRRAGLLLHCRQRPLQRLLARGAGGEILSLDDRLASIRPVRQRSPARLAEFRQGLVEVKRREDLYPAAFGHVTMQASRLFRAELPFPSRLPEGSMTCARISYATERSWLPCRGRCRSARSGSARNWRLVDQAGPLYGLGAIVMALVLGWLGGAVLRRL